MPKGKYCKHCGKKLKNGAKFCPECGQKTKKSQKKADTTNYFKKETTTVEELMHFPFNSFKDFQSAVKNGEVIDIEVQMDHARKWAMQSKDAPKNQRVLKEVLMITCSLLLPIFYIIIAFFTKNYWLLPYSLVPLAVFFVGNPITRKAFPLHWILLTGFIVLWLFSGSFPSLIYWLPILIEYKILDYIYRGSAQLIREFVIKDEKTLILFWKYFYLGIYLKNGERHLQSGVEKNGEFSFNEDVRNESKMHLTAQEKCKNNKYAQNDLALVGEKIAFLYTSFGEKIIKSLIQNNSKITKEFSETQQISFIFEVYAFLFSETEPFIFNLLKKKQNKENAVQVINYAREAVLDSLENTIFSDRTPKLKKQLRNYFHSSYRQRFLVYRKLPLVVEDSKKYTETATFELISKVLGDKVARAANNLISHAEITTAVISVIKLAKENLDKNT